MPAKSNGIIAWKSKGLSGENIKPTLSDNSLTPRMVFSVTKIKVKFDRSCLKQEKITFNHKSVIILYIA